MSFWSAETIETRFPNEDIVTEFKPERVKNGAYEMGLGAEVLVTSGKRSTKQLLKVDQQVAIPPGQFCLLMTEETVSIPLDAIGFISIKASIKFRGLVNVSGFHIDPGFRGRLKYSVFNAGSDDVVLQRGEPAFPMWLCSLDRKTSKGYEGVHANQVGLTSADASSLRGEIASPGSLKRRLDGVDRKLRFLQSQLAILLAIGVGLFVAKCGG